jgi:hypothetical protein
MVGGSSRSGELRPAATAAVRSGVSVALTSPAFPRSARVPGNSHDGAHWMTPLPSGSQHRPPRLPPTAGTTLLRANARKARGHAIVD